MQMQNKDRKAIFLEFLEASIADLITLLSALVQLVQNFEGGGKGISSNICADPYTFYYF
jgi:hypothetical protein